MSEPRRNIELKARDPDPAASVATCHALGAVCEGTLFQRDTYFQVASGGLKLREETPGSPHLIQFQRAEEPQQRESRYRVMPVADAPTMRAALDSALSILTVVVKRRRLYLWDGVRIHLDDVEGLGSFIELEAVAAPSSDLQREHGQIARLREAFGITDALLLAEGYATQLRDLGR